MIQMNRIWKQFGELTPAAQRQVADFIAFLSETRVRPRRGSRASGSVRDDPFVGIWSDRSDLEDSSAWVRRVREDSASRCISPAPAE
jgi:hypothetical protein